MTVNRTTLLDLPLPVTGTESGVWGDVTNNGLTQYLDIAIAGRNALTSANFSAGALTISLTEGDSSATNIAAGSAQYATLYVSSLAQNSTITAPSSNRAYRVVNADATYTLTVKAAGQTGVVFPVNTSGTVVFNGTDYVLLGSYVIASAGTASLPSITFTGDTNTGIFSPAADTIAFTEGGAEAMRIDSNGNVGIGTTSPNIGNANAENAILTLKGKASTRAGIFEMGNFGTTANDQTLGWNRYFDGSTENANIEVARASSTSTAYMKFSTNGGSGVTERMRIDSSGNVGIGTASPSTQLHLYKNAVGAANLFLENASSSAGAYATVQFNAGTVTSQLFSDAGGGVYAQSAILRTTSNHPLIFGTNSTERARITSGGNLLVGTTSVADGELLNVTSTVAKFTQRLYNSNATTPFGLAVLYTGASPNDTGKAFVYCQDSTTLRAEIRSNGGLANFSANNVNLASDQRLKKDISPLATAWSKVKGMEVVNFRYKDCNEGDPLLYGVIAQQVQPIVPELVVVTQEAKEAVEAKEAILDEEGNVVEPAVEAKEATPEYFGIREQPMYWLAIKALQEAMIRIETLEAQNAAFEARLAALEAK